MALAIAADAGVKSRIQDTHGANIIQFCGLFLWMVNSCDAFISTSE